MKGGTLKELGNVIAEAKHLAVRYRELTGKPLGITGEVAEYEAARLLGLRLQDARQPGYDAVGTGAYEGERIEIKGRCLSEAARTQRVGRIKLDTSGIPSSLSPSTRILSQSLSTRRVERRSRRQSTGRGPRRAMSGANCPSVSFGE